MPRRRPGTLRATLTGWRHDIEDPISLLIAGLETLSFYWAFLAGIGVLTWFVLYIV